MAISAGFKQACPSCEALVPIKDPRLIGRKIDCPRCKYRFVIEDPADADKKAVAAAGAKGAKEAIQDKSTKTAVKNGKSKTAAVDEVDEVDEGGEQPKTKAKAAANGKSKANGAAAAPAKKKVRDAEEDEGDGAAADEDQGAAKKKKKSQKSQKLVVGLALAVVGLAVLGVAAFFILRKKDEPVAQGPNPPIQQPQQGDNTPPDNENPMPPDSENKDDPKKDDPKKDEPKDKEEPPIVGELPPMGPPGPEISNLLPNDPSTRDPEHVVHYFFKDIFGPLREAAFNRHGFIDAQFRQRLGFSVLDIDDLVRAERYTQPAWTFTVFHTRSPVDLEAMKNALGLKPGGPAIKGQEYYVVTKGQVWLEQFGKVSFGAPERLRHAAPPAGQRPLYVALHDPQIVVFADEAPIKAFLNVEGKFITQSDRINPPKDPDVDRPNPNPANPNPITPKKPETPDPKAFPKKQPPKSGSDTRLMPPALPQIARLSDLRLGFLGGFDGYRALSDEGGLQVAQIQLPGRPGVIGGEGRGGEGRGQIPGERGPFQPGENEVPPVPTAENTYMTIKKHMKEALDRVEARADVSEKVLVSMVTDLPSARLTTKNLVGEDRNLWRFRQLWDVTHLVQERNLRARMVAVSLIQKNDRAFTYRQEVTCPLEADAKDLTKALIEQGAPDMARFIKQLISHNVRLPQPQDAGAMPAPGPGPFQPVPPGPGVGPRPPGPGPGPDEQPIEDPKDLTTSRIRVYQESRTVDFALDLVLDPGAYGRLYNVMTVFTYGVKGETELVAREARRHSLATAGKLLGEKGMSDRGVAPGNYPPGAFPRESSLRVAREPQHRISWMAGLLPHLGYDGLYRKIDFRASWKDPQNWMAARTVVPEFLDPMYPDSARYATHSSMPMEVAATHFVGLAGIGLDAADYPADDPTYVLKRGVFGYDQSAALKEVREGRGASNTILMIQVPHDGLAGVAPWMAGGGATVRGVPEKNSIAPFVLSNDRNGKPITYNGKRGTYALMVDGTVRWIDASISDEVFKAMSTVRTPNPADLSKSDLAELIPPPEKPKEQALPKEEPPAVRNDAPAIRKIEPSRKGGR